MRPFSPGGSVQFSFLLWIPITLGQARFQALEVWNIFGNFVTDFFSPFLNLWTSFQEFPWQHRSGQRAGFAGIREAGYQVVHCYTRTENGTFGAQIKILRSLFITNTPLKPLFRHFGNHFRPRKSDFWPFSWLWSFSHWNSHWSRKILRTAEGRVVHQKQKLFWKSETKWNNLKPCRSWRNKIFWIRITLREQSPGCTRRKMEGAAGQQAQSLWDEDVVNSWKIWWGSQTYFDAYKIFITWGRHILRRPAEEWSLPKRISGAQ